MHSERAASRRRILAEFARREPIREAHLWIARIDGRPERQVRDACFRRLAQGVAKLGATSIVVDSCAQDAQDQRVIAGALAEIGALSRIRFDIVAPSTHEMLWAADLVAWAYEAGGAYRQAVEKFVTVHKVN